MKIECSCETVFCADHNAPETTRCALCKAAPELYFIAEIALRWFDARAKDENFKGSFPTSLLRGAVAKAEQATGEK